jgi:hypothetical protein
MEPSLRRGPDTSKPSYTAIDAEPQNRLFMHLFRQVSWLAETQVSSERRPGRAVSSRSLLVGCRCHLGADLDMMPLMQKLAEGLGEDAPEPGCDPADMHLGCMQMPQIPLMRLCANCSCVLPKKKKHSAE